jgi:hypothetical protein
MSFFDKLFGRNRDQAAQPAGPVRFGDGPASDLTNPHRGYSHQAPARAAMSADEQAVARYRYLLQTAPPDQIEQAHAEAFANMTPQQRAMVLQGLAQETPASEHAALAAAQNDPRAMARYATRAEMRNPGTLERSFAGPGGQGGGMGGMMGGMGGMIAGSLLASVAGAFIGTAIADQLFADYGDPLADAMPAEDVAMEEPLADESYADTGEMGDMGGFEEF